ncbi:hypothetical protein BGZ65_011319, partial [Modicella reniformis]
MISDHSSGVDYFQEFRILSVSPSASTIFIQSKLDKKTGERIVLWKDIQREIKNADRIRNGNKSISFMTDGDFEELVPLRILYHPGIVLDVIVASQEQEAAITPASTSSAQNSTRESSNAAQLQALVHSTRHDGVVSATHRFNDLTIATMETMNENLATQSTVLEREQQKFLQGHERLLHGAHLKGDMVQQQLQISNIDNYIMDELRMLDAPGNTFNNNNNNHQLYTIRLLQQMINRQVILENRIQAVMTQNYELHEYPIPRLFIVLPKAPKRRDKIIQPLTKQFRLYFLCEC